MERASELLRDVNLIYGLVSGVMLKFAFDWSSRTTKYDKPRSWLALGLAVGSLAFSAVLLTLMGEVAIDIFRGEAPWDPTIAVFTMIYLVVIVLAGISLFALARAVKHLATVYRA